MRSERPLFLGIDLSTPVRESLRADSNRFPAHYELACGYPSAYHHVSVRSLLKPGSGPSRRRPSHYVPARTNPVAVPLQYVVLHPGLDSFVERPRYFGFF